MRPLLGICDSNSSISVAICSKRKNDPALGAFTAVIGDKKVRNRLPPAGPAIVFCWAVRIIAVLRLMAADSPGVSVQIMHGGSDGSHAFEPTPAHLCLHCNRATTDTEIAYVTRNR